jgi:hypothetical protein
MLLVQAGEHLHNLYSSRIFRLPSQGMRDGDLKEQAGEMGTACKRDESYGRPMHRWKDNIKIVLYKIGFYDLNWIHIYDRGHLCVLENSLMNYRLSQNAGNLLTT